MYVFLGFVHTGNVCEGNLDLVFPKQLSLALAEGHRAAFAATAAALHLTHEEKEETNDDEHWQQGQE